MASVMQRIARRSRASTPCWLEDGQKGQPSGRQIRHCSYWTLCGGETCRPECRRDREWRDSWIHMPSLWLTDQTAQLMPALTDPAADNLNKATTA